jgi:hypothetical protein
MVVKYIGHVAWFDTELLHKYSTCLSHWTHFWATYRTATGCRNIIFIQIVFEKELWLKIWFLYAWCIIKDCLTVPVIANGLITLTQDGNILDGTIANVSCSTGYNATVDVIRCRYSFGTWDNAACNLIGLWSISSFFAI